MRKTQNRAKSGQTMVEYIIIVVIIAIAAIAIFGVFGDRLREMVGGATEQLGGDETAIKDAKDIPSEEFIKTIGKDSGN